MSDSPYLHEGRLQDVLAAIQIMGESDYAARRLSVWVHVITGNEADEKTKKHWRKVFQEHREFFRANTMQEKSGTAETEGYILLQRRVYEFLEVGSHEVSDLPDNPKRNKKSRRALSSEQTRALMEIAIDLHSGALAEQREKRWMVLLLVPFGGALFGSIIPAVFNYWVSMNNTSANAKIIDLLEHMKNLIP